MNPFEDDRFNEESSNPFEDNPFDQFNVETPVTIYKTKGATMTPRERIDARHAAILFHLKNGYHNHLIVKDLDVSAGLVSSVRTANRIAQGTPNRPSDVPKPITIKEKREKKRINNKQEEEEFAAKVRELCKGRISANKIAVLLGCGRDKVRNICKKFNIERSYFLGPAVAAEIRRAYKSGEMTQGELAQEYKCGLSTICQLLSGDTYAE